MRKTPIEILLEVSIINQQSVLNPFLDRLQAQVLSDTSDNPTNEDATRNWIKRNFRNYMINDYPVGSMSVGSRRDLVRRVTAPEPGLDSFVISKGGSDLAGFLSREEHYAVVIPEEFIEESLHVIDYLNSVSRGTNITGWVVKDIFKRVNDWSKQKKKNKEKEEAGRSIDVTKEDSKGVKSLIKFSDGSAWVKILDVKDADVPQVAEKYRGRSRSGNYSLVSRNPVMRRETYYMNHCIGASNNYSDRLSNGSHQYYSYRDSSNIPIITCEFHGEEPAYIDQIYGEQNSTPDSKYFPFIRDLLNKLQCYRVENNGTHFTERMGMYRAKTAYVFKSDVKELYDSGKFKELAKLGLGREVLRKMGLVQFGQTVISLEDLSNKIQAGTISTRDLKDTDLSKDELEKMGLIRTASGDVKTWNDMSGETIPNDITFDAIVAPINFAKGIKFAKNLKFRAYPGKSLPAFDVAGDLIIESGSITEIAPGTRVGGTLKIDNITIDRLSDVKCKSFSCNAATINEITNFEVIQSTKIEGNGVISIGKNCVFGKNFDAGSTGLQSVHPRTVFNGHVYIHGTPLTSFDAQRVRGSLLAYDCKKLKTIATTSVGFDEGGERLSAQNYDKNGGNGVLDLSNTAVKQLPNGLTVAGSAKLPKALKSLPSRMTATQIHMYIGEIKELPRDIVFDTIFLRTTGSSYTVYYHPDAYERIAAQRGSEGKSVPEKKIIKPGDSVPPKDKTD